MSEDIIVKQCAPTLAGIKTGSLFPYPYTERDELTEEIRRFNSVLTPRGLCLVPVRVNDGRALMYMYRPERLKNDLRDDLACRMLEDAGYCWQSCEELVAGLARRMRSGGGFPHEVGLFLSYPPEDVKGFIDNKAGNCKCVGYWKVYGDSRRAEELFEKYRKCTDIYCQRWRGGTGIDRLAVKM